MSCITYEIYLKLIDQKIIETELIPNDLCHLIAEYAIDENRIKYNFEYQTFNLMGKPYFGLKIKCKNQIYLSIINVKEMYKDRCNTYWDKYFKNCEQLHNFITDIFTQKLNGNIFISTYFSGIMSLINFKISGNSHYTKLNNIEFSIRMDTDTTVQIDKIRYFRYKIMIDFDLLEVLNQIPSAKITGKLAEKSFYQI
jgi:hypothetical protein